eukprot:TRINITY_DN7895_c0_g4_i2.p2 TRINITY_DN7895_c0_g4~~TRINITY_DN7895_c0_g4_i2.p2  ORF type:complete len:178 (+),score=67.27 TRINITY_DN7895_c0_g4_i2:33-536(+)
MGACERTLKELEESLAKSGEESTSSKYSYERLNRRATNLRKHLNDLSSEILPAASIARTPVSRKFSGEVEVFHLADVVIEKQKMAECSDAYFNGQLIEERQKEIEEIEVLMVNLHGIVKDLAQAVENQDEKFIRIGENARKAAENTKKAKQEVIVANENRGLANNKM